MGKKQQARVAILVALIGAVFGNLDRVYAVAKEIIWPKPSPPARTNPFSGTWYGTFKEFSEDGRKQLINHEVVDFARSSQISGTVVTISPGRNWQFTAQYDQGVYIAHYFGDSNSRPGGMAYVLRGLPGNGALTGYWIGTDPDRESRIVVGPYVLTRENNSVEAVRKYEKWLSQPLYDSGN